MAAEDTPTPDRHIPAWYDEHGEPFWHSTLSPPDPSYGICHMVPDRVIPVIFVPGIMGSNLKSKSGKGASWRLDTDQGMLAWATRGAAKRKRYLTPEAMTVDDSGKISISTQHDESHLRARGWGEAGYTSYGEFLAWLEHQLNDYDEAKTGLRHQLIGRPLGALTGEKSLTQDEVALSYRYRFPVWACGYNWLDDNGVSASLLQKRIMKAISHYTSKKLMCEKVIVVTHSMGGLVARHCSEVLGEGNNILGIVHGVMPAIGAAAVYRRAKSGTRSAGGLKGWAASLVLGADAAEMTAVLSTAPGAMQLLPTPQYGTGWLRFRIDGQEIRLPKDGDPYSEIYTVRGKWWSLCDDQLMDPLNDTGAGSVTYKAKMEKDWAGYTRMIKQIVKPFHRAVADKYHRNTYGFYANSKAHLAYGDVSWKGQDTYWFARAPASNPLDGQALNPLEEVGTRRSVSTSLGNKERNKVSYQTYTISEPEEPGDGTVPERSGRAPSTYARSLLTVSTDHEAAFRDCEAGRLFTLRAIVKIAQAIKTTSSAYT